MFSTSSQTAVWNFCHPTFCFCLLFCLTVPFKPQDPLCVSIRNFVHYQRCSLDRPCVTAQTSTFISLKSFYPMILLRPEGLNYLHKEHLTQQLTEGQEGCSDFLSKVTIQYVVQGVHNLISYLFLTKNCISCSSQICTAVHFFVWKTGRWNSLTLTFKNWNQIVCLHCCWLNLSLKQHDKFEAEHWDMWCQWYIWEKKFYEIINTRNGGCQMVMVQDP